MGRIDVRNVDNSVVIKLDEMAAKKGMSREAYVRAILTSHALSGELKELDYQYANLVRTLADNAQMQTDIIDRNNYLLEELLDFLDNLKNQSNIK